jgi:hypothetical protein
MDMVMAMNRKLQKQKQTTSSMDFSQIFTCQISSVILRHYFNRFGNVSVFYPNLPNLYVYHIFWARVAGRLIWACFSSKIPNTAPYPREVKDNPNHRTVCVRSIQRWTSTRVKLLAMMPLVRRSPLIHEPCQLECPIVSPPREKSRAASSVTAWQTWQTVLPLNKS